MHVRVLACVCVRRDTADMKCTKCHTHSHTADCIQDCCVKYNISRVMRPVLPVVCCINSVVPPGVFQGVTSLVVRVVPPVVNCVVTDTIGQFHQHCYELLSLILCFKINGTLSLVSQGNSVLGNMAMDIYAF